MEFLAQCEPVDAVMLVEIAVLGDDDGAAEAARDAIEWHPILTDVELFALRAGVGNALPHERSGVRIAPADQDRPGQYEEVEPGSADDGERYRDEQPFPHAIEER